MTTHAVEVEYQPRRAGRDHGTPFPALPSLDALGFGAGVAAAALSILVLALFLTQIVPSLPAIHAPAPVRAAFYAEMSRSLLYRSLSYMGQLQMPLLLLFFGGLLGVLRRVEGGSGALSFTVFGAGVVLAVVSPLTMMIEDHLMLGFAAAGVDPGAVAAVDGLVPLSFAQSGFPQALVLGGSVALLRRAGRVPGWLAWSGVALAALSLLGTATLVRGAFFPASSLATVLTRLWILALAVVLRPRAAA